MRGASESRRRQNAFRPRTGVDDPGYSFGICVHQCASVVPLPISALFAFPAVNFFSVPSYPSVVCPYCSSQPRHDLGALHALPDFLSSRAIARFLCDGFV